MDLKVKAIVQYHLLITKMEFMWFLGLVGYYQAFCKNFLTVDVPLMDLLKGKAKYVRSAQCPMAFENVTTNVHHS